MKNPLRLVFGLLLMAAAPEAWAEDKDIKTYVKENFQDRIHDLKNGIYCKALSCEFDIDSMSAVKTAPETYQFYSIAWLQGTIPGLKGSAKRTLNLIASYTRGTCIIKDVNVLSDRTENNNGWGASRIEEVFKAVAIPTVFIMNREDCAKADAFIAAGLQG